MSNLELNLDIDVNKLLASRMSGTDLEEIGKKQEEKIVSSTEKPKIAIICPDRFPGVCQTMKAMQSTGLTDLFVLTREKPKIPSEAYTYRYIILGGWAEEYEEIIGKHSHVSVLWCSSIGQMELSNEFEMFSKVVGYLKNNSLEHLLTGSRELYISMKNFIPTILYMPYPVMDSEIKTFTFRKKHDQSVGIFLPWHPRKNIFNQIYAVSLASMSPKVDTLTLYTNIKGIAPLKSLTVVNNGWLERKAYLNTIKRVKVGLHVTHTESFGQQALEYMLSGTPVVMSPVTAMNLKLPEELVELMVFNVDSPTEIADKIINILTMKDEEYKLLSQQVHVHSRNLAKEQNELFKKFIDVFTEDSKSLIK